MSRKRRLGTRLAARVLMNASACGPLRSVSMACSRRMRAEDGGCCRAELRQSAGRHLSVPHSELAVVRCLLQDLQAFRVWESSPAAGQGCSARLRASPALLS